MEFILAVDWLLVERQDDDQGGAVAHAESKRDRPNVYGRTLEEL
jgi:hypothetical protein